MAERVFVFSSGADASEFCKDKPMLLCYQDGKHPEIVHSISSSICSLLARVATEIDNTAQ